MAHGWGRELTKLGPEWRADEDGVPRREGARIVLFDRQGRVLLIRGHDAHDPTSTWWFTVGGGLAPGETPRVGAARELLEETGISLDPNQLVGPVLYREAEFVFLSVRARQDEFFYLAGYEGDPDAVTTDGFTDVERQTLDELKWFTVSQVEELSRNERIYPQVLPELIAKWAGGWDGEMANIADVTFADPDASDDEA